MVFIGVDLGPQLVRPTDQ